MSRSASRSIVHRLECTVLRCAYGLQDWLRRCSFGPHNRVSRWTPSSFPVGRWHLSVTRWCGGGNAWRGPAASVHVTDERAGRRHLVLHGILLVCAGVVAAPSFAQQRDQPHAADKATIGTVAPSPSQQTGRADIQAGSRIAASGAAGGAAACVGCHGSNGEGNQAAGFPALVGQSAFYLEKQMRSFANGDRVNPVMTPIAKALDAQQRRDVSAWYASLPLTPTAGASAAPATGTATGTASSAGTGSGTGTRRGKSTVQGPGTGAGTVKETGKGPGTGTGTGKAQGQGTGSASARQIEQGRILATQGDAEQRVQACANCHGPGGGGEAPIYPSLAGQPVGYFTVAMDEWKSGTRKTDPSDQMPFIARQLGTENIAALAAYFASLPRSPLAQATNVPAGSSLRPAVAASKDASGSPAGPKGADSTGSGGSQGTSGAEHGAGTEQGAPFTGGSQGPGGGGGTKVGNANPGAQQQQAPGQQGQQAPLSQPQQQKR